MLFTHCTWPKSAHRSNGMEACIFWGPKSWHYARLTTLTLSYSEARLPCYSINPHRPLRSATTFNGSITRLFRVLRDRGPGLREKLTLTPYSELEFESCQQEPVADLDELELAPRRGHRSRDERDG